MEHFVKMATSYDMGELVGYKSQICLISEIRLTQGGYNIYYLEDIDAERTYVAFKQQLVKASQLDLVILDGDVDMGSGPSPTCPWSTWRLDCSRSGSHASPAPTPAAENRPSPQPSTSTGFATNALPTAHSRRFATLTTQDDELASSRTSKNTNEQTKWEVRGEWTDESSIFVNCNHIYLILHYNILKLSCAVWRKSLLLE